MFPHHESEIAQSRIANGSDSVKYWMHNNMITINGQKMGKSLGNFITWKNFLPEDHPGLTQATARWPSGFFILQAHYRSTLDFSMKPCRQPRKDWENYSQALRHCKRSSLRNFLRLQISGNWRIIVTRRWTMIFKQPHGDRESLRRSKDHQFNLGKKGKRSASRTWNSWKTCSGFSSLKSWD